MTSTIAGLLDDVAEARPDQRLLLEVDGGVLTVAEVARLSAACIRWLADSGVRPGMTVAWQLPSHSAAAVLMLALAGTETLQAPMRRLCRQREVRAALDVAAADILIVDDSTAINAPPDVSLVTLPADFLEVVRGAPGGPDPTSAAPRSPDDARWIYFTSGTIGRPKGVRRTDATLLAAARGYTTRLGLGSQPDDVGTIGFPIAHIGGILYLASALIGALPALLIPKIGATELPRQLAENSVTISGSSTAFYQMLLAAQLASGGDKPLIPSLRVLIGGDAPCPPKLHYKVRTHMGVPLIHAYGMTEAPTICVSEATDSEEQQSHTCGRPIPGVRRYGSGPAARSKCAAPT